MKTNTSSLMDGKNYTEAQKNEERVSNANIMRDATLSKTDRTCNNECSDVCGECQVLHISEDCEEVKNWDSFVEKKNAELVQKLIDKDIFNQATLAMEEHYGSGCTEEIDAYFRGAKWMQENLKNNL